MQGQPGLHQQMVDMMAVGLERTAPVGQPVDDQPDHVQHRDEKRGKADGQVLTGLLRIRQVQVADVDDQEAEEKAEVAKEAAQGRNDFGFKN